MLRISRGRSYCSKSTSSKKSTAINVIITYHRIENNYIVEVGGKTFKTMSMRKSMVSAATLFQTGGIV